MIDQSYLPDSVRILIKIIGFEKAMQLVNRFGGTQVYIAKVANPSCPVAKLIGIDSLKKISKEYCAGSYLNIPKANALQIALRNQEIRELKKTLSNREIAIKLNLSSRQITRILNS